MSRCTVCRSGEREQIEDQALTGGMVRVIARRHGLSESALRRHLAQHVRPALQAAARQRVELHAGSILQRLASMADDAEAIRNAALTRGATRTAVAALDSERAVLALIMDRLNVSDLSILAALREHDALSRAMAMLANSSPEFGEQIARHLRELDEAQLADMIQAHAELVRARNTRSAPAPAIAGAS